MRVDHLDRVSELLTLLPDESRRRYLAWVLEPRKDASQERIRFVLRELRLRFREDAELEALELLAEHDDPTIASDALVTAIALTDVGAELGRLASRRIGELPRNEAIKVTSAMLSAAPAQLTLETVADERIGDIAEAARGSEADLAAGVAARIERFTQMESLRRWCAVLDDLAAWPMLATKSSSRSHVVLAAADQEPRSVVATSLVVGFFEDERFRRALWRYSLRCGQTSSRTYSRH